MSDPPCSPTSTRELGRLRRLAALAALALGSDAHRQTLLDAACQAAADGCAAPEARLFFFDRARRELVLHAAVPANLAELESRLAVDAAAERAAVLVVRNRRACIVDDPNPGARSPDAATTPSYPPALRTAAAPVGEPDAIAAVIEVAGRSPVQFCDADLIFLEGLAAILAAVLARRNVEHLARSSAANAMVLAAEREVFAVELEHRVANHLQQILLALRLEQRRAQNDAARLAFGRLADRVGAAISLNQTLRHPLTDGDNERPVAMASFLETLARDLAHPTVAIDVVCDEVFLPLARAITVGRLVNEIVINAIKHAFAGRASGRVSITLLAPEAAGGDCTLVIADNGTGLTTAARAGSQGLALIAALADQLGATLRRDETPLTGGTRYRLEFPANPQQRPAAAPGSVASAG